MKKLFNSISSAIILVLVVVIIIGVCAIARQYLFNEANKIYDKYEDITYINIDYGENKAVFSATSGNSLFDWQNVNITVSVDDIHNSKLIVIDNAVTEPTMIDNILHIPERFQK